MAGYGFVNESLTIRAPGLVMKPEAVYPDMVYIASGASRTYIYVIQTVQNSEDVRHSKTCAPSSSRLFQESGLIG